MEKGIEQGIGQGIEQGIEQGILAVAKNLLNVLDNETISLKTGLDTKTIQALRDTV